MMATHCWLRFKFHDWDRWHVYPNAVKQYRFCARCGRVQLRRTNG